MARYLAISILPRLVVSLVFLLVLQACQSIPRETNGISHETLNPRRRPCQKDTECNNLLFTGYCDTSLATPRCTSLPRSLCTTPGAKEACAALLPQQCRFGVRICKPAPLEELYWGDCKPTHTISKEICNEIDDDCDGQVDEGFFVGSICSVGLGSCLVKGSLRCVDGKAVCDAEQRSKEKTPQEEICNNVDDDCDGKIDELLTKACTKEDYKGPPDTFHVGTCHAGTRSCNGGTWGACEQDHTPQPENCWNDQDDDCNGIPDREDPACDPCLPTLLRAQLKGHTAPITNLQFMEDGVSLLSSSEDGTLRLWDLVTPKVKSSLTSALPIKDAALRPSPSTSTVELAYASGSKLYLHEVSNNRIQEPAKKTFQGHSDEVLRIAFSSDGKYLASVGADQRILVWDVEKPAQPVQEIWLPTQKPATDLRFFQKNQSLVIANRSPYLYFYDPMTGQLQRRVSHLTSIHHLATSDKIERLAFASEDNTVSLWSPQQTLGTQSGPSQSSTLRSITMSLSGNTLAAAYNSGKIIYWDLSRTPMAQQQELQSLDQPVTFVHFDPRQLGMASATQDHTIHIWRCPTL